MVSYLACYLYNKKNPSKIWEIKIDVEKVTYANFINYKFIFSPGFSVNLLNAGLVQ